MDESRKDYWDGNYARYWQARVKESNREAVTSSVVKGDSAVPSDRFYVELIGLLEIEKGSRILEMGCGFGRSIPFLFQITQSIDAIDISSAMIDLARKECAKYQGVNFHVCEAESTPFETGRFARVICFGVLDALYQSEALLEINRMLAFRGRALITGKNDFYYEDDEMALVAERNARAKGHPNYFTDVTVLLNNIHRFGFTVVAQRFFPRRGDTSLNHFSNEKPERFYEYALVLEKTTAPATATGQLGISSTMSKTFRAHPLA
jgi:ubiquinone/menaquinone biosynthesis C-methylase UbiE